MYLPVALIALLALLAAILGLVPNTLYAQEVIHALLAATTGSAILHLLVLASSPRFKLYAYFLLPLILLSCATLLGVITPFTSIKSHIPSIIFLTFTLSTLPHTVFLLLNIQQPPLSIPPLSLPLPPPLPSPTSSASSFPSSQSHEKPLITGTFADYKSSILPPPPALLFTEHPTSSWFSHSDVESLTDQPIRTSPSGWSFPVLLQIPILVLAAQLCSILASAFEIPAMVLASNPETGMLSPDFISVSAALVSTFQILQATFTLFCLVLVLLAYYRYSLTTLTEPAGTAEHKPTRTPPPTPASELSSSRSRSGSASNSTDTYRPQSLSKSRSRDTLTPAPPRITRVFPPRTSTPIPTAPKSGSNSRYATASSDSINNISIPIPIPVSIPVHTYVQHAYTHARVPMAHSSSSSSSSSPRPRRTPLRVCTSFSSLTTRGRERERDATTPTQMSESCCMRVDTAATPGPCAILSASSPEVNTNPPNISASTSITSGSNYSHTTPSDELALDDVDLDRNSDTDACSTSSTLPHARPATPTLNRRLNLLGMGIGGSTQMVPPGSGSAVPRAVYKTDRERTFPQRPPTPIPAHILSHPHSYPNYSHPHPHSYPRSSSHSHSHEDHDFTDLRDPFAPRVSSYTTTTMSGAAAAGAHLVSPHPNLNLGQSSSSHSHYVLRASLPIHPISHSHSHPHVPSHHGHRQGRGLTQNPPTRMSAWGRLQFPVRLPLPTGASATSSSAGFGLGLGSTVVQAESTSTITISGTGQRTTNLKSHGRQAKSGATKKLGAGGSKDRRVKKGNLKVGESLRERVLEDIDMEDSALLAQRLLRRLQRQA